MSEHDAVRRQQRRRGGRTARRPAQRLPRRHRNPPRGPDQYPARPTRPVSRAALQRIHRRTRRRRARRARSASPRAPSTATTWWSEPTGCTRPSDGSRSVPSSSFCATSASTSRSAALPDYTPAGRHNPMYNFPGHLTGIAAYNDKALAVFMFRSAWIDYDYHDLEAQKRILADAFAGHTEWRVPELVDAAVAGPGTLLRLRQPDSHAHLAPRPRRPRRGRRTLRLQPFRSRDQPGPDRRLVSRPGPAATTPATWRRRRAVRTRPAAARHPLAGDRRARR